MVSNCPRIFVNKLKFSVLFRNHFSWPHFIVDTFGTDLQIPFSESGSIAKVQKKSVVSQPFIKRHLTENSKICNVQMNCVLVSYIFLQTCFESCW